MGSVLDHERNKWKAFFGAFFFLVFISFLPVRRAEHGYGGCLMLRESKSGQWAKQQPTPCLSPSLLLCFGGWCYQSDERPPVGRTHATQLRAGGNRALLLYVIVIKRNCVLKSKTNKRIKPSTNTAPGQLAQCIRARAAIVNSKRPKMGTRSSSASFHYHHIPWVGL